MPAQTLRAILLTISMRVRAGITLKMIARAKLSTCCRYENKRTVRPLLSRRGRTAIKKPKMVKRPV